MIETNVESSQRYQALLQLLRTSEDIWNASRIFFGRWDLSSSQFNVLNLLFDMTEGCNQIELSRLLIMHRSNATGLIDRLEARGLLQRKPIARDRRAHQVVLTAAGRKLVRDIRPEYYRSAQKVWDTLSDSRVAQVMTDLSQVSSNIKTIENTLK